MKFTKPFFYLFICITIGLLPGCAKKTAPKPPPTKVTAFQVTPQTIPAEFQFVGVAKSSHPVEIRSRVEGYLMSIDYIEGSVVKKDQKLFQIDPRQFIASLDEAKAQLARQEAILWRAQKTKERIEPLYKQNAASLKDLDDAIADELAAEASVLAAKANVVNAELNLSYTKITSPILGLAGKAQFREGTLITPSVNGYLTEVSVIDPIWVYFSISESELLKGRAEKSDERLILPKEQQYTVALILGDGSFFPYTGIVNFSSPTLDPITGTMNVRAQFQNPHGTLLPGQFVQAIVCGAFRPDAIFVPQQSVFQGSKGKYVFVIDSDNKISMRLVEVGDWFSDYWIISKGLSPGELVIDEGVNKVQAGQVVDVTSITKPAESKKGRYINDYESNDVNDRPADS